MSDACNKTAEPIDGPVSAPSVEAQTLPDAKARDLEFHPIRIKGEPLSETIIRERR
jgi:hypothetical protein